MKAKAANPRHIAVGVLKKIGERLSSDERAPYEKVEHDESFDLGDPTNPNAHALRTDENDAQ